MRGLVAWALAGLIGCVAWPAIAQRDAADLAYELEILNLRIDDADRLLREAEAGNYLIPTGPVMVVMSRDRLVEWATDQLYREGAGISEVGQETVNRPIQPDEVGGQERTLRRVREIVAGTPVVTATLRQARQDDMMRREDVRRELARLNSAGAGPANGACRFPHSWQVRMENGSVSLAVDASGNVSGSGIATGRATLAGNRLTLQWLAQVTGGEMEGRYIVTLDAACNGAGELVLDRLPPDASQFGIRGGPVTFTSQSAAGPS